MFKQKVSRVLATITTLALVVSVMPQMVYKSFFPEAKAVCTASLPPSITGSTGSGSTSVFFDNDNPSGAVYKIESSNTSVISLTSFSPSGGPSWSGSGALLSSTHTSPSTFSGSLFFTKVAGGSATLTATVEVGGSPVCTDTASVSISSNTAPQAGQISPSSANYSETAPVVVSSPVIEITDTDGNPVSVDVISQSSGMTAVDQSSTATPFNFSVPITIPTGGFPASPYSISFTLSDGITTTSTIVRTFTVTNQAPVIGTASALTHFPLGNQDTLISVTDPTSGGTISSASATVGGAVVGSSFSAPTLTVTTNGFGSFSIPVTATDNKGAVTNQTVTASRPDNTYVVAFGFSTFNSFYGITSPDKLTKQILEDNPGPTSIVATLADADGGADLTADVDCTLDDPSGFFDDSGVPFSGSGSVSGGPYSITFTPNPATFQSFTLGLDCTQDLSGGGAPVAITASDEQQIGASGGGDPRRRADTTPPVIEKQGDDGYKIGAEIKYDFGNDLKLSASYDYSTQVRACFKKFNVVVGADGREITRVSTGSTSGMSTGTLSIPLKYDWNLGLGASLGYDYSGTETDDDFTGESLKYLNGFGLSTDWNLGFGLSLGGKYGAGYDYGDIPVEDNDYPADDGSVRIQW